MITAIVAAEPEESAGLSAGPMKSRGSRIALWAGLALLAWLSPACDRNETTEGDASSGYPPHARVAEYEEMKADLARPRHPSDGGGTVRLEHTEGRTREIRVSSRSRFELRYEAGPLGIAKGGAIYFLPDPFWGWSPPQTFEERAPGYTAVHTDAEGVKLDLRPLPMGLLFIGIEGRALEQGETVFIDYGAGPAGAQVDRFAERGARLWIAVDGDGDGVRKIVGASPTVDILPGPPSQLVLTLTSTAAPGDEVRLTLAVLDALADVCTEFEGTVELLDVPDGVDLPDRIEFSPRDGGTQTLTFRAPDTGGEGVLRLRARAKLEADANVPVVATSNPLWVTPDPLPFLWADLHGHSNFSDGTGLPGDYFRYARDVAALDAIALTDHDHFGVRFLDSHPAMWDEIQRRVRDFHEPGRFVTVLGYEWTNWLYGHRHVLYFQDGGELHGSLDPQSEHPTQLWARLLGQRALTYAHHSAGDPVPIDWSIPPDPQFEPVTEIMSIHGSSEAADSPMPIGGGIPGNFVRDILEDGPERAGYRLGFIGSGDSHDGHPGLPHLSPYYGYRMSDAGPLLGRGGLAAVLTADKTRQGIYEAMKRRAVYATSGPRILLVLSLEGHEMGAVIQAGVLSPQPELVVTVIATAPLTRLDVVQRGEPVESRALSGETELGVAIPLEHLEAGDYVYVRVVQSDSGLAWSSPVFVE